MTVMLGTRRAEHAERVVRPTEQPDAGHDKRTHEQGACPNSERPHEAAPLTRRIREHRSGVEPAGFGVCGPHRIMVHEGSVRESGPCDTDIGLYYSGK